MKGEIEDNGAIQIPPTRAGHIKKRVLKNKGVSVSFNEKDLRYCIQCFFIFFCCCCCYFAYVVVIIRESYCSTWFVDGISEMGF
jgi:hypothetical protein